MGRKGQNKQSKANKPSALLRPKEETIKLSPQKRSELNQIVDKLLKGKYFLFNLLTLRNLFKNEAYTIYC